MITVFNNLEDTTTTKAAASAAYTPVLTALCDDIASKVFKAIKESETADIVITTTFESVHAMETELIVRDAYADNIYDKASEILVGCSQEVAQGMLKSQMSKASRSKNGGLTVQNYKKMMSAVLAIKFIRMSCDIPAGSTKSKADIQFDVIDSEAIAYYTDNQDKLRAAIRNVQAKKCSYKKAAGENLDEAATDWLKIIEREEELKALRVTAAPINPEVVAKADNADKVADILKGIDTESLKAKDAKQMLADIRDILLTSVND